MKKILLTILLGLSFAAPFTASAITYPWDRTPGGLYPLNSILDIVFGNTFRATSTSQASIFPFASTTVLSATGICFTGDLPCRTTWPTDTVGNWFTPTTNYGALANSTSTPIWFQQGIQASSTSRIASTTFAINGNVGIGQAVPANKLDVAGSIALNTSGFLGFVGNTALDTTNYSLFGNTTLTLLNARSGASIGFRIANTDVANFSTTGGFGFGATYYNLDPGQNNMIVEGKLGVGTSTPWRQLSVGTGNAGTFAISTSTAGCAAFSSMGELFSTGGTCNTTGWPFLTATTFATTTFSTTTPLWLRTALYASSTPQFPSYIDNLITTNSTSTNATTTNLFVTNPPTFSTLTSALLLTGASGLTAEYAGTSVCTAGQAVISLNALGVATCGTFNTYAFPFTPTTYNGATVNSTTTGLFVTNAANIGLIASTSVITNATTTNATTTSLSVSGQIDFDQLTSALIQTGSGGILAEYAGTSCTGSLIQSLSALGIATCAGYSAFPFTPATNYVVNTNSTTTPLWLRGATGGVYSLMASSTSAFDQINVGSTTIGTMSTSTIFGNLSVRGLASSTNLITSAISACSGSSALNTTAAGQIICGAVSVSGGTYPFTPILSFNTTTSATTSPIWGVMGIFASSTSRFHEVQIGTSSPAGNANSPLIVTGNVNSFTQSIVQNLSNGNNASACQIVGNDLSTDSRYYGEFCINGSGYVQAGFNSQNAGDVSLLANDGALVLSTASSTNLTADIRFTTGGTASSSIRGIITQNGYWGAGTSTPKFGTLTVATSTVPQLILSSGAGFASSFIRSTGGNLFFGTTTIAGTATTTSYAASLTILANGQVSTLERDIGTSTGMVIDWNDTPNQIDIRRGSAAITIGFNNASTSGMTKRIVICSPGGTAGTVTFVGPLWAGGTAPTFTTTANKCDIASFIVTQSTSTTNALTSTKVFGAVSQNF